jgi:hypothetical protein
VNKLLNVLIVWFLLAAIPFQGVAAASMLACAPAQAHMAMAPEHCAMMGQGQHHAAADSVNKVGVDAGTDHSSQHHQSGSKCSTCASCCCVAALAPPAPVTRAPVETSAAVAFHADDSAVALVDLALPERPPKHFADLT